MWTAIAITIIVLAIMGGLITWAISLSGSLSESRTEAKQLRGQVEALREALRLASGADPDLDELVRVFTEPDPDPE